MGDALRFTRLPPLPSLTPPPPLRFAKARQMTFFKESQQRIASFSLKKSLTKRRLCEAYGLGGTQASDPSRPPPPRHRHFAFYGKKLGKNHYGFLQRKHSQRIASFFMVKNLDQETSLPKAQWKVFWRCKRGRPMEGRPRTSTLSFSLPLVCSPILNGMVIFYVFFRLL